MDIYRELLDQGLDKDPKLAIYDICEVFYTYFNSDNVKGTRERVDLSVCYETKALLDNLIEAHDLSFSTTDIIGNQQLFRSNIIGSIGAIFGEVKAYRSQIIAEQTYRQYKTETSAKLGHGTVYEFTEDDFNKLQVLINELRDILSKPGVFSQEHQRRLLKRVEKLQAELNKVVSDFDHYLGLFLEVGHVLGEAGEKSKPFFDRIEQVQGIVGKTIKAVMKLPPGVRLKMLGWFADSDEPVEEVEAELLND